jgi:hypothetical protein
MAYEITYSAVGNREDLSDIVKNISPTDTPVYSFAGKDKATGTLHEWIEDELRDPKANANIEGADYSAEAATQGVRKGNYTQIIEQAYGVSETEQAVDKAGTKNLIAKRMRNAMKECALDVEYAIIKNTAKVAGDASTARQMGGVEALVTTNVNDNGGTARALTEELFNDTIQLAWAKGGNPNKVVVSGKNKRNISNAFMGSSTQKTTSADDKRLTAAIDIYESDFGIVSLTAHRQMGNDKIFFLDDEMVDMAVLRPFKTKDLNPNGDRIEKVVVGELTFVIRAEKACAILSDLDGTVS